MWFSTLTVEFDFRGLNSKQFIYLEIMRVGGGEAGERGGQKHILQ